MSLPIKDLHRVDDSGPYIVETNVIVHLKTAPPSIANDPCLVRVNVYRPKGEQRLPVLVTYGPCTFSLSDKISTHTSSDLGHRWKRHSIRIVSPIQ